MRRWDRQELAAIFVGGALGALLRGILATLLPTDPTHWPWATFTVNIVGVVLLAYFSTRLQERLPLSAYRRPLLGTGLCGGLTTFSTMQVEILNMLGHQAYALAVAYATVSIVAGLVAIVLTTGAVRRVPIRLSR